MIDRLDTMRVFVTALNEGSLAKAGRRLGRSPAAVSRAVASLESHFGTALLHRTTRRLQPTEAGERYAEVCRQVLGILEEANRSAEAVSAAPQGVLSLTAPVMFGNRILRPIVGAFLSEHPNVQVRFLLLNRITNLVDEGIDVALRIAPLRDSSLIGVKVGEVRRVLCAAPDYLARRGAPSTIFDLSDHDCIAVDSNSGEETWSFPPAPGRKVARNIRVRPRLMINDDEAAVNAAVDGGGVLRVLSYKVDREIREGALVPLLPDDDPPPVPVNLVTSRALLASAKVRAFMDFAAKPLRASLRKN